MTQQLTTNPITVTLTTDPRIHLKAWTKSVHKCARALLPAQDLYGALSLVCSDPAWALLRRNTIQVDGGAPTVRDRPVYPIPVPPQSDDSPAVRQVWKHQNRNLTLQL